MSGIFFKQLPLKSNVPGSARFPFYNAIANKDQATTLENLISLVELNNQQVFDLGTITGSANTYVSDKPITEYYTEAVYIFQPNIDSTNISTLNVNELGGLPIKEFDGTNLIDKTDLKAVNTYVLLNKTSYWLLIGGSSAQSTGIQHAIASGIDTYTATITGVTAYADGDVYFIRFTNGNTTGCTLNINSLGAVALYRNNDGPLLGGDILNGGEMLCVYNSALNIFQVIGTAPNSLFAYVTNEDSVTLTKGMPVYAFSGTGDRMTVKRASNLTDATSARTVGFVLSTSIGVNQKGIIMMQGLLDGLNILPTSTWSDGDPVYLGATAGTITNIKPHAPNHLVYLGVVTTASNGSAGRMYVKVQNGYELDELHNVQAQNPSLKDILWYDNSISPAQWKTASISTVLGYTPENVVNKATTMTGNTNSNTLYLTAKAIYDWAVDLFLQKNVAITGATKTKITYDENGLVTTGADATTADIADSTNKRYQTDNQQLFNDATSSIQTQLNNINAQSVGSKLYSYNTLM